MPMFCVVRCHVSAWEAFWGHIPTPLKCHQIIGVVLRTFRALKYLYAFRGHFPDYLQASDVMLICHWNVLLTGVLATIGMLIPVV